MKLRVLGCSGGIGGNFRTTSLLLDHDILIDAGTGLGDLSLAEMSQIDHIFITHSHLDHIACLPLLVDSVGFMRDKSLLIHATAETLAILQRHIFNWETWPDFSVIPNTHQPVMQYEEIRLGEAVEVGGRKLTPLPVNHVVPAVGFKIDSGEACLVFSGDTTTCDAFWHAVNGIQNLRYLIVETAFSDAEKELAVLSKHLCPSLLEEELAKLKSHPEIFITHLKPGEVELTMKQIAERMTKHSPLILQNGQEFEF
ncbi:MAG: 3',5'-cyclic-nucleotide phosphodiesterase [Gallionella sp.]|nr:3',5'-cyclic-nucleotide phosphodiesterase [Gallionella sp.]